MKCILGEKIGMTQMFDTAGNTVPATLVYAAPNVVIQVRTREKDGYSAIQLGFGQRNAKKIKKPQMGHFKGLNALPLYVREFRDRTPTSEHPERGAFIDVGVFQEGDRVRVSGLSKAKGFQGVVKRHGFHGAPASHGTKHAHRQPGSLGATWPQRVIKGMRMAGRMGGRRMSVRKAMVVGVDAGANLLAIKGAVPGRRGALLEIRG
ncbi:MAG: 50S ribosomal protein L3 [Candidatus Sungbacteria bacterium]|nr:50S ribosomal protein L3 [Candidatus Sungbacteria bacterium]